MNQMGHNNPPLTPYETALAEISSLFDEAQNWLDGEPVENQGTADKLSRLLNEVRAARKRADDARKAEAKPFDDAKKEIQDRYNPLLKQADLAIDACKKAMTPWLEKLEAEKRAAEIEARRIADEKRKEAEEAARSAAADDLVARQDAEAKIKAAKDAEAAANRAAKDKGRAHDGVGQATTLRTSWEPEIIDATAAARHYWTTNRTQIEDLLMTLAKRDVARGLIEIPGFKINEIRKAV
jgi:hypothetical protein